MSAAQELLDACRDGDLNAIKRIVEEDGLHPDDVVMNTPRFIPTIKMVFMLTPITASLCHGEGEDRLEIVRYFVEKCHARRGDMDMALMCAAIYRHVRSQAYLMAKGAEFPQGPFPKGCMESYISRALVLHPLFRTIYYKDADALKTLLDDGYVHVDSPIVYASDLPWTTALTEAARLNKWKMAEILLDRGANPTRTILEYPAKILQAGVARRHLLLARYIFMARETPGSYLTPMEKAMKTPSCPSSMRKKLVLMRLDADRAVAVGLARRLVTEFAVSAHAFQNEQLGHEGRMLRSQRRRLAESASPILWFQKMLLEGQQPLSPKTRLLAFVLNVDGKGMPDDVYRHMISFVAPSWRFMYAMNVKSATTMIYQKVTRTKR